MKILHLGKFFPPYKGGIETVTYDIYSEINAKINDIQVDVLCFSDSSISKTLNRGNVTYSKVFGVFFSLPISFDYVVNWVRMRNKYEIIHVHFPNPLAAVCLVLFPPKSKIVVHWHSDIVKQKLLKYLVNVFQNAVLHRCEAIILTSERYLEFSDDLIPHTDKSVIIPIGVRDCEVNLEEVTCPQRLEPFIESKSNKKIILSVGRLTYYKGFENLIRAAVALDKDYQIIIAGSGELFEQHSRLINDLQLEDKVFLLGSVSDSELSYLYHISDIFCLPSIHRSEAYGVVQCEAMRSALPVISTDIPGSGVSWVNKDGVSGVIVEPCSPQAIVDACSLIYASYSSFSVSSRDRYLEKFRIDQMIEKFEVLYRSL